jgi:hypothetical protein
MFIRKRDTLIEKREKKKKGNTAPAIGRMLERKTKTKRTRTP